MQGCRFVFQIVPHLDPCDITFVEIQRGRGDAVVDGQGRAGLSLGGDVFLGNGKLVIHCAGTDQEREENQAVDDVFHEGCSLWTMATALFVIVTM